MSSSYIQTTSYQWIHKEQTTASCKLSSLSPIQFIDNHNLQDKFRLDNVEWRSWHHQQTTLSRNQPDYDTRSTHNTRSKFYVDDDEDEQEEEQKKEEEEEEEDCDSTTWSFSSFEEEDELASEIEHELHFVKKMDEHEHPVYTAATATAKKPISLLTQMLNGSTPVPPPPPSPQQTEKEPLLKRCQSKYQSLSSWFATSNSN